MSASLAKKNSVSEVKLTDFPIPKNQVLEGSPVARIWVAAQSEDLKITQGVWDCTQGKFTWDYSWDESVMILEGEVTVEQVGGQTHTLKAGDFMHLPRGIKTKWFVPKYLKKTFVIRTLEPLNL